MRWTNFPPLISPPKRGILSWRSSTYPGLVAGLKGNQWWISPDYKATYLLGGYIRGRLTSHPKNGDAPIFFWCQVSHNQSESIVILPCLFLKIQVDLFLGFSEWWEATKKPRNFCKVNVPFLGWWENVTPSKVVVGDPPSRLKKSPGSGLFTPWWLNFPSIKNKIHAWFCNFQRFRHHKDQVCFSRLCIKPKVFVNTDFIVVSGSVLFFSFLKVFTSDFHRSFLTWSEVNHGIFSGFGTLWIAKGFQQLLLVLLERPCSM